MSNVGDHRDLGAFIPAVLDDYPLDPFEFRVYARIVRRAGGPRGHDESAANVGRSIGCGARKVREAYDLLTAARLVARTPRPGRSDRFTLRPSSEWVDPARIDELRAAVKRDAKRTPKEADACGQPDDTAVPPTAVPPTAVGEDGQVGRTDRATAVPPTYEGTPVRASQKDHHPPRDADTDAAVDNAGGGGGSAAAEELSPAPTVDSLLEVVDPDHLEVLLPLTRKLDDVRATRLLADDAVQLHRLAGALAARTADGWAPEALARQLTDGPLDDVTSIAAVLRTRAERLAGVKPLGTRTGDADGIPPDVAAAIDLRAREDAWDGVGSNGAVDPDLERELAARYRAEWLAEHQAQEVGAR